MENTFENVKIEEDKSFQTDNTLDLVLKGEIGEDCEEELIGETFWKIRDDYYFDSWHTHSVRRCPVNGCMVGVTGNIFVKGTYTAIGNVVDDITHTLY